MLKSTLKQNTLTKYRVSQKNDAILKFINYVHSYSNRVKFKLHAHRYYMFSCFGFQVFFILSLNMPYNSVLKWPPRSPDLTPCDFFLWGYVKGLVYVPPLPTNVVELKQRISSALETVTEDMLQRVWDELGYRLDVCRVAGGAHIENL